MTNVLHTFYNNSVEREAVKQFLIDELKQIAIERAFDGKDTKSIPDAKECIENAFDRLEEVYGKKDEPINSSPR